MFYLGLAVGFIISFLVIKRSINKTGYGQLKMCRETCPYYSKSSVVGEDNSVDGDDDV